MQVTTRPSMILADDEDLTQFTTEKSRKLYSQILDIKQDFEDTTQQMENSIQKLFEKHELEYMQAYNIFVKNRENELKRLIDDVTNQLGDKVKNDKKMKRLELNEHIMKGKAVEWGNEISQLKKDLAAAQTRMESEKQEKIFYHSVALENKKQKKLLKISLARLNDEFAALQKKHDALEKRVEFSQQISKQLETVRQDSPDHVFVTATKLDETIQPQPTLPQVKPKLMNAAEILKQQSLMSISDMSSKHELLHNSAGRSNRNLNRSILNRTTVDHLNATRRVSSMNLNTGVRYKQGMIPTENLKFEQLVKVVFESKMTKDEIKHEIISFVQQLETQYTEQIKTLMRQRESQKKQTQQERIKNVSKMQDRSDLESLFVDCVEDVRKDVIKRRLKTEITQVKSKQMIHQHSETNLEFEQTLEKLADMAKGRIKLEELTVNDRINLLDLFVNNEKTLLLVHESLFPKHPQSYRTKASDRLSEINMANTTMLETSSAFDSQTDLDGINVKPLNNEGRKVFQTIDKSMDQIKNSPQTDVKQRLPAILTPSQVARSDAQLKNNNHGKLMFEPQPHASKK